jgi:signal transduction histidine kinase
MQRLDARKQAYLSMVHHEVSAPLELMKKGLRELDRGIHEMSSQEAKARLEWLRREVDRLEKLSSDILDITSVEKGRLRLRRREVDMRELTSRAVEEMALTGRNPVSTALPSTPVIGLADAARLEQVMVCMLDNAMKFSSVGSEVKVRLSRKKNIAHWEIEDKGAGMESEQLQALLEFLAGEGRPGAEPKTGLGLFLCHHIIQAHKGDLRLDSKPGRGTRVSFSIPLERKR